MNNIPLCDAVNIIENRNIYMLKQTISSILRVLYIRAIK